MKSKYFDTLIDILDGQFPKGECQERGRALAMFAYIELMLNGTKFNKEGIPLVEEVKEECKCGKNDTCNTILEKIDHIVKYLKARE